jgi:hypothetical protein
MYFLSSCFLALEDRDVKKTESLIVMALLFSYFYCMLLLINVIINLLISILTR